MQRESIIRGPAVITHGGNTYFSRDDIKLTLGHESFDIENSAYGIVDKRTKQRKVEISFTPDGQFVTGLWPYGGKNPGDRLMPDADGVNTTELVISPKTGKKYTFYGCVLTKMPQMLLSTVKTLAGPVTFTAIGKENVLWETANSLYTEAAAAFGTPAFNPTSIKTGRYAGVWGSILSEINTREGWVVDFDLQLDPVETDDAGIIDWTVGSTVVTARCMPLGIAEEDIIEQLKMQGTARGATLKTAENLVITGQSTMPQLTLYNASLLDSEFNYGLIAHRIPELKFQTIRGVTANALDPAFLLETVV